MGIIDADPCAAQPLLSYFATTTNFSMKASDRGRPAPAPKVAQGSAQGLHKVAHKVSLSSETADVQDPEAKRIAL